MGIELLPHQHKLADDIISRLAQFGLAIVQGEQRTGKTFTAIHAMDHIPGPHLIVTKKKPIKDIQGQIEAYEPLKEFHVINYESVHKAPKLKFGVICLDECHYGISGLPKDSKAHRGVSELFRRTGARAILMSGTTAIETKGQYFQELSCTGRGPWTRHKSYYEWYNPPGHYRDRSKGGGYGDLSKRVRIKGGQEVPDYKAVDDERVMKDLEPYLCGVTREQAGFQITESKVFKVFQKNDRLESLVKSAQGKVSFEVETSENVSVTLTPEGGAQSLQMAHMLAGGTFVETRLVPLPKPWKIGKDGEPIAFKEEKVRHRLSDRYDPTYRIRHILDKARDGCQYPIFTAYVGERDFVQDVIGSDRCTQDMEEFKSGAFQFWVGSLKSYAEGFDLSWLKGTQVIYSCTWSGAAHAQILDRQLKFTRTEVAKVAVMLLHGSVDADVLGAVTDKKDFNAKVYERISRSR